MGIHLGSCRACGNKLPPPVRLPSPPPVVETPKNWYTFRHDSQRTGRSGFVGPSIPKVLYSLPYAYSEIEPLFDGDGNSYIPWEMGFRIYRGTEVVWELTLGEYVSPSTYCVNSDRSFFLEASPGIRKFSKERELLWEFSGQPYIHLTVNEDGFVAFTAGSEEMFPEWGYGLIGLSKNGELLWTVEEGEFFEFAWASATSLDGNLLITARNPIEMEGDGAVLAKIDISSGDVIWETFIPGEVGWTWDSPTPAVADDGTIYIVDAFGVHAFSDSGEVKWSYFPVAQGEEGPMPWAIWMPALALDGTIYVQLMEEVRTYATAIVALNPDGSVKWRRDEYVEGSPIVDAEGTVYIGKGYGEPGAILPSVSQIPEPMEPDNTIVAINPDGTTKWVFSAPEEIEVGRVLSMDNDGNLVVIGRVPGADYYDESIFFIGDE